MEKYTWDIHIKVSIGKKRRRLEKESWAQYGRMYYMNGDALEVARQIFPRTSEEIEQRIRRMMK